MVEPSQQVVVGHYFYHVPIFTLDDLEIQHLEVDELPLMKVDMSDSGGRGATR